MTRPYLSLDRLSVPARGGLAMTLALLCACASSRAYSDAPGSPAPTASTTPGTASGPAPMSRISRAQAWRNQVMHMSVNGSAVGYGGVPGGFYMLLQAIKFEAQPAEIATLLRDPAPPARALALAIIAGQEHPDARTLAAHVCDDGRIGYMPAGCIGGTTTVGRFARDLLRNPGVLSSCVLCIPPLERDELWRLDWEILARDDCSAPLIAIEPDLKVPGLKGDAVGPVALWGAMRRALPSLSRPQLARAIGRYGLRVRDEADLRQVRELLESIVADESQRPDVRQEAASTLNSMAEQRQRRLEQQQRIQQRLQR